MKNGFTILELIIVLAIVSILSSIAIPAYNDYTLKAKFTQAISIMRGAKIDLVEAWAVNGSYPDELRGVRKGYAVDPGIEYVDSMTYNYSGASSDGEHVFFLIRMDRSLVDAADVRRRTIALAGLVINNRLVFRCGIYNGEESTDIPLGALPKGCDTINVSGTLSTLRHQANL